MEIKRIFLLNPTGTKGLRKRLRNNSTPEEVNLWQCLKNKKLGGIKFRRQYGIGPYIVDFYSTKYKLIIELDGGIHEKPEQIEHDKRREEFLIQNEFNIIRFKNKEVNSDIDLVLKQILEACQ